MLPLFLSGLQDLGYTFQDHAVSQPYHCCKHIKPLLWASYMRCCFTKGVVTSRKCRNQRMYSGFMRVSAFLCDVIFTCDLCEGKDGEEGVWKEGYSWCYKVRYEAWTEEGLLSLLIRNFLHSLICRACSQSGHFLQHQEVGKYHRGKPLKTIYKFLMNSGIW